MNLPTQPYKGARDFYPADKRLQNYMFDVMRRTVESFGFEEYAAPILEPLDIYRAKTGQEIVNDQIYAFVDRGEREVAIRPEMTPSVSRMVAAQRQQLPYPLRWYSIPDLWRYERPQRGRLREHWQLNVDIFGLSGVEADHELILISDALMKAFGASKDMYSIRINSRTLIDQFMEQLGLDKTQSHTLGKLIDRMKKIDQNEFLTQAEAIFSPSQREAGMFAQLSQLLAAQKVSDLPASLQSSPAVAELQQLMTLLEDSGVYSAVFDPTIMRGFDYYTGIVFEVFDTNPANNRSMFGGGRYDGLVGLFGVEPVPTTGFGMGDVTLQNFLETHDLLPHTPTPTDAYVILIGQNIYPKAQRAIRELRDMGLAIAVDSTGRKPDKQIKTALKKGIGYVIFIGEKELSEEIYSLKNLNTGQEERHSAARLVSLIKDYRQPKDALTPDD